MAKGAASSKRSESEGVVALPEDRESPVAPNRYEDFLRASVDWVWEVDRHLNYSHLSKGIGRVLGVPSETLLGGYIFALSYFRAADSGAHAVVRLLEQRLPFRNRPLVLEDAQGRRRTILLSGVPVFDPASGGFLGYRGTGRERQQGPEVVSAEVDELRQIIRDYAELAVSWRWETDAALHITKLSDSYAAVSGRLREQALGQPFATAWRLSPGLREQVAARLAFYDEAASWFHARLGEERRFLVSGRPMVDPSGRFLGYRGIGRDVTRLLRSQEQAQVALAAAEQASHAKTEFLANMSHELRTSLNAIIGFSDAMRTGLLGARSAKRYQDYAEDIHVSGRHLLDIVNEILDLSRIEAGQDRLELESVDMAELIESCCRILRPQIEEAGLEVAIEIHGAVPKIHADPAKMRQILLNLLDNAIKYTPSGGRIAIACRTSDAGQAELEVRDSGKGVKPGDIPKVMARYGQVDRGKGARRPGTGLGLSITKSLVELHGGAMEVSSQPGRGLRTVIRLPKEGVGRPPEGGSRQVLP